MNPDTSKDIGTAIGTITMYKDFISGLVGGIGLIAFGVILSHLTKANETLLFSLFGLLLVILSTIQFYRRLSKRKNQSTNLAYQSTDGNVGVLARGSLDDSTAPLDLSHESIKAWIAPLSSSQSLSITGLAIEKVRNAENTLILTDNYLIGLVVGPGSQASSAISQLLNLVPESNVTKMAIGNVVDRDAIKNTVQQQISTKHISQLVTEFHGFTVELTSIESIQLDSHKIKIDFKNGQSRSWVETKQDGSLQTFYQQLRGVLPTTQLAAS